MNMEMNYKKIIKEKMLDDAKAHAYKMSSERPCFSRWDVASFDNNAAYLFFEESSEHS